MRGTKKIIIKGFHFKIENLIINILRCTTQIAISYNTYRADRLCSEQPCKHVRLFDLKVLIYFIAKIKTLHIDINKQKTRPLHGPCMLSVLKS